MRKKWIFFVAPPGAVLVIALVGEAVMHLWNWLLPGLLGAHTITFWQSLGMLVLCRILFGSWQGGGGPDRSKQRRWMGERWERMTPEERERFRSERRGPCGPFSGPEDEPKETTA